jgi:hypothetical protein
MTRRNNRLCGKRGAVDKGAFRAWLRNGCLASVTSAVLAAALIGPQATEVSAAEPVITDFSLAASGYSTDVSGGALPVESGRTGFAGISCTRFANKSAVNNTAGIDIPSEASIVSVGATTSRALTVKDGDAVHTYGRNDVTSVVVGNKSVAALEISGIKTRTHAWHDASGFHRAEVVKVAQVTRFVAGDAEPVVSIPPNQNLDGQQLRIPGVASVTFGERGGFSGATAANSTATALRINLEVTGTEVIVGSATARIQGGAVAGIMNGEVWGSQLTGLGGVVNSGRTASLRLACLGTDGAFETERVAGVSVPGILSLGAITSRVRGSQSEALAHGISTVARAGFAGRGLVVTGIRAEGKVTRTGAGDVLRSAEGTTLGSITLGGRELDLPLPGRSLVIPGVARITRGLVTRGSDSIKVVGLRVQLLQGSVIESTVDLANVRLQVRRG